MKKSIIAILIVTLTVLMTSCINTSAYTGTVGSGYQLAGIANKDYEILGSVTVEGKVENILGIYTRGGVTHKELLDAAKEMKGHDVINVRRDVITRSYFFFYNSWTEQLTGTVIRYTNAFRQ